TLRHVAIASDISVRHATRLLKQQTRAGFLMHLHRARVGSASHLLRETTLSVKEVAARVGYGSSVEVGKQLKRRVGTTPIAFRHLHSTTNTDGSNRRRLAQIDDE